MKISMLLMVLGMAMGVSAHASESQVCTAAAGKTFTFNDMDSIRKADGVVQSAKADTTVTPANAASDGV